ncbi:unnamed protein product [Tilletia controversa]|nr:unnamed protein product [Tilletia controversa]
MRFALTTAALALFALGASPTVSASPRAKLVCATNAHANQTLEAQLAPLIASQREQEGSHRAAPRVVQVHVHVISSGSKGNISSARIQRQMAVLNSDYSQANYRFKLASTSHTDKAAWYGTIQDETTPSGLDMKKALHRGGKADLNLYVTSLASGLLGYGTFPWFLTLAFLSFPHSPFQGETCASNPGDYVSDTPKQRDPTYGCPKSKNTCSSAGADSIHNFMDYSDDACMQKFTAGQVTRLHVVSSKYRGI